MKRNYWKYQRSNKNGKKLTIKKHNKCNKNGNRKKSKNINYKKIKKQKN